MNSNQNAAEITIEIQAHAIRCQAWQCCLNCLFWDKDRASCDKFKAVPPPHIIVSGCKDYDNDIPF